MVRPTSDNRRKHTKIYEWHIHIPLVEKNLEQVGDNGQVSHSNRNVNGSLQQHQLHWCKWTFITCQEVYTFCADLSPVSIQTQSLALRALHKRKLQETQALALASSQSWLPLLRPSIPIGWCLRLLRENTQRTQRKQRKRLRLNGNRA